LKFLTKEDQAIYEFEVGNDEDKFITRRKSTIKGLRDFRKSQQSKHAWRASRWKHLQGIRRFHKSTAGKRFHRSLGRFLTTRYTRDKSSLSQRESYDLVMALGSVLTHAAIEQEYFFPSITEACEYEEFVDYISGEVGQMLMELHEDNFDFDAHEEVLLRLCETNALISSFAEKTGKSVQEVEAAWNKAKDAAKEEGKEEDSENFYAYVVTILKSMLNIK
jgi:hypothetical protein